MGFTLLFCASVLVITTDLAWGQGSPGGSAPPGGAASTGGSTPNDFMSMMLKSFARPPMNSMTVPQMMPAGMSGSRTSVPIMGSYPQQSQASLYIPGMSSLTLPTQSATGGQSGMGGIPGMDSMAGIGSMTGMGGIPGLSGMGGMPGIGSLLGRSGMSSIIYMRRSMYEMKKKMLKGIMNLYEKAGCVDPINKLPHRWKATAAKNVLQGCNTPGANFTCQITQYMSGNIQQTLRQRFIPQRQKLYMAESINRAWRIPSPLTEVAEKAEKTGNMMAAFFPMQCNDIGLSGMFGTSMMGMNLNMGMCCHGPVHIPEYVKFMALRGKVPGL